MAEPIDETDVIAWLDGELAPEQAARVEQAVATNPGLAAIAETHRAMRARFAAAFGPIAAEPVMPARSAEVVSLAAVRAARSGQSPSPARRWWVPGAIAASLVAGLVIGQLGRSGGISDRAEALALAPSLARALDAQLSGQEGAVRVALSFRSVDGAYCRSFTASHLSGIACRTDQGWRLRYGAPAAPTGGAYRMAGNDPAEAGAIAAMIAGEPLDAAGERAARAHGWRR
jgi:hypothetical protein